MGGTVSGSRRKEWIAGRMSIGRDGRRCGSATQASPSEVIIRGDCKTGGSCHQVAFGLSWGGGLSEEVVVDNDNGKVALRFAQHGETQINRLTFQRGKIEYAAAVGCIWGECPSGQDCRCGCNYRLSRGRSGGDEDHREKRENDRSMLFGHTSLFFSVYGKGGSKSTPAGLDKLVRISYT